MKLRLRGPEGRLQEVFVTSTPVWVGRGADCDVILPDQTVSRQHCRFVLDQEGAAWVEDVGSRYGTYVNSVRATQKTLVGIGDQVRVGEWAAEVFDETLDPAAAAEAVVQSEPDTQDMAQAVTRETRLIAPEQKPAKPSLAYILFLAALAALAAAALVLVIISQGG